MSARVVPVGYILTDDALQELVTTDPEWRRLDGEWMQATGDAKAEAHRQARELQDQITAKLFNAAKAHELPAIALKRTTSGDWFEHQLPDQYLEELAGDLALWTGSVARLPLNVEDRWIADAPLCFRRIEFERWRPKPRGPDTAKAEPSPTNRQTPAFPDDLEIMALARPVIERIVANGQQLRRLHFEPMLRELTGDRLPPKAGNRLWPELAPPDWRASGKRPKGKLVDDWRSFVRPVAKPI